MTPLITTSRLLLRPHEEADVPFMVALNADPEVVRYTGDVAFIDTAEAAAIIASLRRQFAERRLGRLVVIERASGERLGWCGLKWHEDEQGVDLGFRFFRAQWGKGYATESGAACLRWLADNTAIRKVFAHAMPENIGSVRVLQKLGFVAVGPLLDDGFQRFES